MHKSSVKSKHHKPVLLKLTISSVYVHRNNRQQSLAMRTHLVTHAYVTVCSTGRCYDCRLLLLSLCLGLLLLLLLQLLVATASSS
jgi:hypothetical protein